MRGITRRSSPSRIRTWSGESSPSSRTWSPYFIAKARDGLEFEAPFHQIYRYDEELRLTEFHGFVDDWDARREAGLPVAG
jgi:hypothetical protein